MVQVVFSYSSTSPRLWSELSAGRVVWLPCIPKEEELAKEQTQHISVSR